MHVKAEFDILFLWEEDRKWGKSGYYGMKITPSNISALWITKKVLNSGIPIVIFLNNILTILKPIDIHIHPYYRFH